MRLVIDLQAAQAGSRLRGIGRYARNLALAMARNARDHDIVLLLCGRFPDEAAELRDAFDGLARVRLFHPPAAISGADSSAVDRRAAAERIRAEVVASLAPDLLHVSNVFEGAYDDLCTGWPAGLTAPPMAITLYDLIPLIHRQEFLEGHWKTRGIVGWYLERLCQLRDATTLLAISRSSRDEAIGHLGFRPERVTAIGAGIDARFCPQQLNPASRGGLLARYGLGERFVLTIGTGDPHDGRKNEEGLIAAWGRLPSAVRKQHCLGIVGQRDRSALDRAMTSAGLVPGEVVVIPYVAEADLPPLYSACSLFVFPSLHEGFGLPVAEAMACGAPVIASATSSLPEVVGRADALFDPQDPQAIADAIARVLADDAHRAELTQYGVRRGAAMFSWDTVASTAWDALETVHAAIPAGGQWHVAGRPRRALLLPGLRPSEAAEPSFVAAVVGLAAGHALAIDDGALAGVPDLAAVASPVPADRLAARPSLEIAAEVPLTPEALADFAAMLPVPALLCLRAGGGAAGDALTEALARALHGAGGWPAVTGVPEAWVVALLAHPSLRRVAAIATPDRDLAAMLARNGSPEPIALPSLMPAPHQGPAARHLLGVPEGAVLVVCADRGGDAARRSALLAAWAEIRDAAFGAGALLVFVANVAPAAAAEPGVLHQLPHAITPLDAFAGADAALLLGRSMDPDWPWMRTAALSAGPAPLAADAAADVGEASILIPPDAGAPTFAAVFRALADRCAELARLGGEAGLAARLAIRGRRVAAAWHAAMARQTAGVAATAPAVGQAIATANPGARLPEVAAAVARSLPPTRSSRFWIDISHFARHDAGSGIQRVQHEVARHLLRATDAPLVDLVRFEAGRMRFASDTAGPLVGANGLGMDGVPVDALPGDTLLLLDIDPLAATPEWHAIRDLSLGGVRIVTCVYDILPMLRPDWFPVGAAEKVSNWYRTAMSLSDGVACISRSVADEVVGYLAEGHVTRARPLEISWFHLAPDFPAPDDHLPEQVAALTGPRFLMVGTIEPRKGHRQALAAFELLWRQGLDLSLVIIGRNGWGMDGFGERIEQHPEVGRRLLWLGHVPDGQLATLYRSVDALLAVSEAEGFGLPLVEAAAAGTPLIARDIPVFREIAGEHADWFHGTEPAALAAVLRGWLERKAAGESPPDARGISLLSWAESARQLRDAALGQRPYRTYKPS